MPAMQTTRELGSLAIMSVPLLTAVVLVMSRILESKLNMRLGKKLMWGRENVKRLLRLLKTLRRRDRLLRWCHVMVYYRLTLNFES
jgi:hypothetical protein